MNVDSHHRPMPSILRVINPDLTSEIQAPEVQPLSRKMSKTLVEPSIEYLPPLQTLPTLEDMFNTLDSPISSTIVPSPTPSIAPSAPSITSFTPSQTLSFQSKYTKASYSLTSRPDALKLYRSMAIKTRDPVVQLTYAKYLLDIAPLYNQEMENQTDTRRRLEEEAVRWIKKLANQGIGEAAYLLGHWLENGLYGLKVSNKALKYYEVAAKARVPQAMFAVAQYHEREKDYMTSFQLYEDAASLGLVKALYRIAMIHLEGDFGSRQNIKVAIQLLIKACEKRDESCPEAPYTLGLLLLNNYPFVHIPNDLIQAYGGTLEAINYLEEAVDMGMLEAQYKLGLIYEQGKYGYSVNMVKAYEYYKMASELPLAMLALSRLLNQGIQMPPEQQNFFLQDESHWIKTHTRDEDGAFRWCRLAADHNLPEALYLLGWYYETGSGVPRDYKQAYRYYIKASKLNNIQAKDRAFLLEDVIVNHKMENKQRRSTQCLVM